jgi:hypothetical protein
MDPIEEARRRRRGNDLGLDPVQVRRNVQLIQRNEWAVYQDTLAAQVDQESRRELQGRIEKLGAAIETKAALMSPPGALPIPPLLEERRWDAGIVDAAFHVAPIDCQVLIYQMRIVDFEDVAGSKIKRPDVSVQGDRYSASQGILVAAGLKARDYLYANGIEIGHIVRFAKLACLRLELGVVIVGVPEFLLLFHCSEIRGSVDLGHAMMNRDALAGPVAEVEQRAGGKHVLVVDGETRDGYIEAPYNQENVDG